MSLLDIQVVKPKSADFLGAALLVAAIVLSGANLAVAEAMSVSGSISGTLSLAFAMAQLIVCLLSFFILGKTASQGTIWGNLFCLGAAFLSGSGVLLATALWALA